MNISTIASYYSLVVGVFLIIGWVLSLATGRVPELSIQPISTIFHIIVELTTAAALITAGIAFIKETIWARRAYYLAAGLLLASLINTIGLYAERGDIRGVFFFTLLSVIGVIITGTLFKNLTVQKN